jgi:hypothetical protein
LISLLGVLLACSACSMRSSGAGSDVPSKITFDLTQLDDEGLAGPPDGQVAISYEFCVPTTQAIQDEIRHIDPTARLYPGALGRIGCAKDRILCIGSTHQQGWRSVLQNLAHLDYIERIDRSFAE